jgi:hypothetical protein
VILTMLSKAISDLFQSGMETTMRRCGGCIRPATRRPGAKAANLCMVKKTELLVTQESDHSIVALLNKKTVEHSIGWDITIAPGVDPALVICTAAIVEDTTSVFA